MTRHFSARPDHGQLHSSLLTPWHENEKRLKHSPPTYSAFGFAKAWSRLTPIRWRCIKDYRRALSPFRWIPQVVVSGKARQLQFTSPKLCGCSGLTVLYFLNAPASGIALFLCSSPGSTAPPPSYSTCPWALLKKDVVEGPCLWGDALRNMETES